MIGYTMETIRTKSPEAGHIALAAFLPFALLAFAGPLAGQLPGATAGILGTANNYTALARGFEAIASNPAALGLRTTPTFSLAVAPVRFGQTLDPISLSDISDYEGQLLPASVKEGWLQDIASSGGQVGYADASVTALSLSYEFLGIEFSTIATADASLNEDAAELLLFGNAGRDGVAKDFALNGSRMNGHVISTLAISSAIPLDFEPVPGLDRQYFAIGATVKRSWGHAMLYGEDMGSLVQSDPLQLDVAFPIVETDPDEGTFNMGTGLGIDLGAAWEGGKWSAAVAVQNVINTFEWDLDLMVYRPGEALFNDDVSESDFDQRPASEAPAELRARVQDMTFKPVFVLGAAFRPSEELSITSDFRQRAGDEALNPGPKTHIGLGAEYLPSPVVPLRLGAALITEGFQVGGGLGLNLGPAQVGVAGLVQRGDAGDGMTGMFSLSFWSR